MAVILILILASLGVAVLFLAGFIWAVRSGQYEDTCTPAMRVLTDDVTPTAPTASVSGAQPKSYPT
jgi:cbb3-type cytochrome oxidase maturation protein